MEEEEEEEEVLLKKEKRRGNTKAKVTDECQPPPTIFLMLMNRVYMHKCWHSTWLTAPAELHRTQTGNVSQEKTGRVFANITCQK